MTFSNIKTNHGELLKFYIRLTKSAPERFYPFYFPLEPSGKEPFTGISWKKNRKILQEAYNLMKKGYNIGIAASREDQNPKNEQSERSKLSEKLILCSDSGASYASDLPENYFNENSHFVVKDCSKVYGDSCPVCRRQQK